MQASRILGGTLARFGARASSAGLSALPRVSGLTATAAAPSSAAAAAAPACLIGVLRDLPSWSTMSLGTRLLASKSGPASAKAAKEAPAKKEKEKPKRLSAYNILCKKIWAELKASGEKLSLADGQKRVQQRWKSISEAEKAELQAEADKLKPAVAPKTKKAPSAFALFIKERMPELKASSPHKRAPELMKECGAEWKSLQDSLKDTYIARSKKLKAAEAKKK